MNVLHENEQEITIPLSLYNTLVERSERINVMEVVVNNEKYFVSREMIGAILGFEVKEVSKDADGRESDGC